MLINTVFFALVCMIVLISYLIGTFHIRSTDRKHIIESSNEIMINYLIEHGFILTEVGKDGKTYVLPIDYILDQLDSDEGETDVT